MPYGLPLSFSLGYRRRPPTSDADNYAIPGGEAADYQNNHGKPPTVTT